MRYFLALLLFVVPAYSQSALLDVTGMNNIIVFDQMGNGFVSVTADNLVDSSIDVQQTGGGDHQLNIDLNGNFLDYEIQIFQNSSSNLLLDINQTCNLLSCSPSPLTISQY